MERREEEGGDERTEEIVQFFISRLQSSVFRAADQRKQHRLNVMLSDGESLAGQRDERESSAGATTLTSALHAADSHTVRPAFISTSGSLFFKCIRLQVHAAPSIHQQEQQLPSEL